MDNWNRNDENEYNGVSAQRRNRRRMNTADNAPEKDPEGPAVPAETEVPAEPETPEKRETPEETEGTEEPKTAEEPETPSEPVVQGPDSRVPPEARRMAAAPYGVPREGAKRPGTRLQVSQRRPAVPEEHRPAPRPRRPAPMSETMHTGTAPHDRGPRVNVGYAPGRMSEEATRQVPTTDAVHESIYGRDAKAYLEKRKQPFRMDKEERPPQDRPGHRALRIVVALIVAAGLILTGWMLLKNGGNKNNPANPEAPQIISFDPPPNTEGQIAPVDLSFSVETGKDVEEIRLHAEDDVKLDTDTNVGDNTDSKIWTMKLHVETGFTGTVVLQVRRSGEEGWIDTEYRTAIAVSTPLGVDTNGGSENSSPTVSPDDDDYYDEDAERTEAPAETTEQTPAPQPAEQVTEQPADQTTEEPEEAQEDRLYTPAPTPEPTPTEAPATATPPLTAEADPAANPDLITQTTVYTSFTKKEKDYNRSAKELIHMPEADLYSKQQLGVLTFRGDNFRRNAAAGKLSSTPQKLAVLWQAEAGSARGTKETYYGYDWTGQPVIARWSTEVRTKSNITEAKNGKSALKEVIIAGVDGVIRFLDLEDGKITRNSIKLGYPMKGTPSLHPRGYPFMAVGQYARKMRVKTGKIGLRQYNLYTQNELKLIDGLDGKYHRPLNDIGSFETSALIDRESDTLIAVGTNGMLYLESLGTTFDYNTGVLTISPSTVVMNSRAKGQKNSNALLAVESSPAAYDKYVYYADMGGVLRCVDTNTLRPVWAVNTGDSVMAAIAMDLTADRELNLYTANMLNNRKRGNGDIQIRRYDALSGKEAWCTDIGVFKSKKDKEKDNVGAKASPVIGQHKLDDLVFFTVTGLSDEGVSRLGLADETPAALIALDKGNGKVAWAFGLGSRSESSPVALYDKDGSGWIVQCEQDGIVHLVDGRTGSEVSKLNLEAEIKASPAAYNNVVVIGTTGKNTTFVYGIEVKLDKTAEETETPAPAEEENSGEKTEGDTEEKNDEEYNNEEYYDEEAGNDEYDEYEAYDPDDEEGGDGRQ